VTDKLPDYVLQNRAHWDEMAKSYADPAERHWAQQAPSWASGAFRNPKCK